MCGNMAVAVSIATPSMSWRVFASSKMCVLVSWEMSLAPSGEMVPVVNSSESLRERPIALARLIVG